MEKFKLSEVFLEGFKGRQPPWGFHALSYFTFKRTYSRLLEDGTTEEFWQTLKRVVEGVYTIQKMHCAHNKLIWDNRRAQRSAQRMFEKMWNFKFLPPGRGLWYMGSEAMFEKGSAALFNCFAYNTEFITRNGIKKIGDCVNTTQTVLSSGGKWIDAPIRSFGKQSLMKITLSRQGVEKVIYTTPEHEWFTKDRRKAYRDKNWMRVQTQDLRPNVHRLQYVFGKCVPKSIEPSPFGIAHGFAFGDGSTVKNINHDNHVVLCGNKDKALLPFFSACHKSEDNKRIDGIPNFFKQFPSIQENKAYLLGWLMGYFAADGSCTTNGQIRIDSTNKNNLIFVQEVCSILGIGTYSIIQEYRVSNLTGQPSILYRLSLMGNHLTLSFFLIDSHRKNFEGGERENASKRFWTVIDVQKTDKVEEVYCATVPDYGCFALADNILTSNCGFCTTANISKEGLSSPFMWMMDMLMLGVGIGFDTKGANLPIKEPIKSDAIHVIPDTREGWVEALGIVLDAYEGRRLPKFDISKLRLAGTDIKGFGGKASGPEPLLLLIDNLCKLLDQRIGAELISVDIVDIGNFIGKCVVSGNVRRAAELVIGQCGDKYFIECKDPVKFKDELIDRRWASNNSIFAQLGMDFSYCAERTSHNGEPGYIFEENIRNYGRMNGIIDRKDANFAGLNPCVEIVLEDKELCNICEVFPANHDSIEEFYDTLKYAYLYSKSVTLLPTHEPRTNAVMLRNRRIGVSQSGIEQAKKKFGAYKYYTEFCHKAYNVIEHWDSIYSDWLCVPRSKRYTTVKPSGTVSLLAGATPGIHYTHSEFYLRAIRVSAISPLVNMLRKAGYCIESAITDPSNTVVVYFPIQEKNFTKSKFDVTIWEQMENVVKMQRYWSDNSVSCTVTFKKEEAKDIKTVLEMYQDKIKVVSFLPLDDHGYKQPPYTAITEDEYKSYISTLKDIEFLDIIEEDRIQEKFCNNDQCGV